MTERDPFRVSPRRLGRLMSLPHVVGFDISSEGAEAGAGLVITVYVSRKFQKRELEEAQRVPPHLDGIPTRVRERGS